MSPARYQPWVVATLVFALWHGPARAQTTIAVLPVDFGYGSARSLSDELASALRSSALQGSCSIVLPHPDIGQRYPTLAQVDLEWMSLEVVRGENAYFEMRAEDAVAILTQPELVGCWEASAEMAAFPEFATLVRRSMLSLALVHYQQGNSEQAAEIIRGSIRRFPLWIPTRDWYPPDFVDFYVHIQEDYLSDLPRLVVHTPDRECAVFLNGFEVGVGDRVDVPLARGSHGLVVECGRRRSRIHAMNSQLDLDVIIDPQFDEAWSEISGELTVRPEQSHDPVVLSGMARTYGDLVGADQSILVGWIELPGARRFIQIASFDNRRGDLVRALRASSGTSVELLVAALDSETPIQGVHRFSASGWPFMPPHRSTSTDDVVGYGLLGLGGAALVFGSTFAFIENGSYSDFIACDADPVCRNSDDLADHQQSGERATLASVLGLSVGAAAVIAGTVLLLLNRGDGSGQARLDGSPLGPFSPHWGFTAPGGFTFGLNGIF